VAVKTLKSRRGVKFLRSSQAECKEVLNGKRGRKNRMSKIIFSYFFCFLLFYSCASNKTTDVKQQETATSTKTSQKPYTVLGQRYEPLQSHEKFVQTGVASWYGKDFHGRKTSSGEKYNMFAMTAAHKTLPLGVFVKVHHIRNGKETIVRVNDRGPFVKGRIIDLSYAAAKKLGIDVTGTGFVKIEALGYRQDGVTTNGKSEYEEPATYSSGNFTVQIGSFQEHENAQRLSDEIKTLYGYSVVRPFQNNGKLFYRVYAGKYTTLDAAEAAEKEFTENGYPGSFTVSLD